MPQSPRTEPAERSPTAGPAPQPGTGGCEGGACDDRPPYVLVVEDDPVINELVGAYARLAGLAYRGAGSGDEAFAQLRQQRPVLVVLDVMLPDLDGFEICRRIKESAETGAVPVVMLTALSDDEYRERGLACGAAEYLTKPFNPDELLEAITRYARGRNEDGDGDGTTAARK
jgi:two-component system OmpR family response regulator